MCVLYNNTYFRKHSYYYARNDVDMSVQIYVIILIPIQSVAVDFKSEDGREIIKQVQCTCTTTQLSNFFTEFTTDKLHMYTL